MGFGREGAAKDDEAEERKDGERASEQATKEISIAAAASVIVSCRLSVRPQREKVPLPFCR